MRFAPSLLAAAALLLGTTARSPAYQPPVVEPGGTWLRTVTLTNPSPEPRTVSARVRARAARFWAPPRRSAIAGEWVESGPVLLAGNETREIPLELPVPEQAPVVLGVEIRPRHGALLPVWNYRSLALAEGSFEPTGGNRSGSLPFRIVGGGDAAYPPVEEWFKDVETTAVRDVAGWDSLRDRVGILSPDSWGLHPDENDRWPGLGTKRAEFAALQPPNLETETLLCIRTASYGETIGPLRLWIRSVKPRSDGTVVCRYSYRFLRFNGGAARLRQGKWLLVAIPRTDAPIEFRRVP